MASIAQSTSLASAFSGQLTGPQVWLDPSLGLVTGVYPRPSHRFDFAEERLSPVGVEVPKDKELVSHLGDASRVVERWTFECEGETHLVGSSKQLLIEGLNFLEDRYPGTLEKLSHSKGGSKRPVAKSRSDLYGIPKEHKYSEKLKSGYFVATNNKGPESRGYLRDAVTIAGLRWGQDFVVEKA
ncbi:hypothetical protein [Blastomonas sp. AAP25]|uniref:hypothetical protein n=1 Tax=Blastomonas TaxID=150203 RepID=UPI0012E26C09|nr:hypothetical protein [Blastomonas sp. AAP25]MDM7928048.1 hypothetical protein [Blastomonas fulva]